MKLHRFIGDFDFMNPPVRITDSALLHQMRNVLRLKVGDECMLADGKGNAARAIIVSIDKKSAEVAVKHVSRNENEPERHLTLFLSLLRRENTEWALQKGTEVGVKEFVLLQSERTVKLAMNEERMAKIVREAAEQSGRAVVPIVRGPESLEEALRAARTFDTILFFDSSGIGWEKVKKSAGWRKGERVAIFIGPEGGWSEKEVRLAEKMGAVIVHLGKLTLRAETAAVIASYLVLHP